MPELPEVEVVRRGLAELLSLPKVLKTIRFYRKDLRFPLQKNKIKQIESQPVISIQRRSKYLFFELPEFILVSHLGMSGSWRVGVKEKLHDHVEMIFKDGIHLIYNDPRRFGSFEILSKAEFKKDSRWSALGPEPLESHFNSDYLKENLKLIRAPIKSVLMKNSLVVGIGNIYASEILFKAKIHPLTPAYKIKKENLEILVQAVKDVLQVAINKGGSTIHSFVNSDQKKGSYQNEHQVYGRSGEKCFICGTSIKVQVTAGRSTYWCVKCQKK